MTTKIFVNLPVEDLDKSKAFFGSWDTGSILHRRDGCLHGDHRRHLHDAHQAKWEFTKETIADATQTTEVLTCLSVEQSEGRRNPRCRSGGRRNRGQRPYGLRLHVRPELQRS